MSCAEGTLLLQLKASVERSAVTTVAAAAESIPVAIAVAVVVLFLASLWALGFCCGRDHIEEYGLEGYSSTTTAEEKKLSPSRRMPTRTPPTSAGFGSQDSEKLSLLEELQKEIHAKDWELERLKKAQAAKDEDAAKLRVKLEDRGGVEAALAQLKTNDDDLERLAASLEAERSTVASQRELLAEERRSSAALQQRVIAQDAQLRDLAAELRRRQDSQGVAEQEIREHDKAAAAARDRAAQAAAAATAQVGEKDAELTHLSLKVREQAAEIEAMQEELLAESTARCKAEDRARAAEFEVETLKKELDVNWRSSRTRNVNPRDKPAASAASATPPPVRVPGRRVTSPPPAPPERYWEQYRAYLSKLEELCAWTIEQQHWVNSHCGEAALAGTGRAKSGYLSWPEGEVRHVVVMYFVRLGGLPEPRLSPATWEALWLEVERDGQAEVPYSVALTFTLLVTRTIRDLLTGARAPVAVGNGVFVAGQPGGAWYEAYTSHVATIHELLETWDDGPGGARDSPGPASAMADLFHGCDLNGDGCLDWNSSEVRMFIARVFEEHGIPLPALSDSQWYALYRQFDVDGKANLSQAECLRFAKFMHEEIAKRETDWAHLGSEAPLLIRNERGTYTALARTSSSAGVQIDAAQAADAAAVARAHDWRAGFDPQHVRLAKAKSGAWPPHQQPVVSAVFRAADANADGHLDWDSSEVRKFVRLVFEVHGLPLPGPTMPEALWYELYREVDPAGAGVDAQAAGLLCKKLLQRILDLQE